MILLLVKTLNGRLCRLFQFALMSLSSLPLTADGLEAESMSQINVERFHKEQERVQNILTGVITHIRDGPLNPSDGADDLTR